MTATKTWQGMVASLGGTPAPIIKALLARRPAHALFVVSESSAGDVEDKVVPGLDDGYVPQYQKAVVSNPQVLGTCYQEIRVRIARWLEEVGLDPAGVYVDITGGTKVMSAALALAAVEHFSDFSYIGGAAREPGTGRVLSGAEEVIKSANPWDTYAVRDLERANGLLRAWQADTASAVLNAAAQRCAGSRKRCLNAFAALAEALARSDRFEFADAVSIFNQSRNDLELSLDDALFRRLTALCGHWSEVRDEVRKNQQTPGRATLLELWANAGRRAGQGRYDDAVGRLYRAIELRGQQLVKQAFGAELGKASLKDFPSAKRDAVRAKFGEPTGRGGQYTLPLERLFQALEFSDDAELREQASHYERLRKPLRDRNNSLLAHGVKPVTKRSFEALRQPALAAGEVTEAEIPEWPELTLRLPA